MCQQCHQNPCVMDVTENQRRWPYDLMQALKWGRCPRCHGFLITAWKRLGAACGDQLCHLAETWPRAQVDDAYIAWRKRKGFALTVPGIDT